MRTLSINELNLVAGAGSSYVETPDIGDNDTTLNVLIGINGGMMALFPVIIGSMPYYSQGEIGIPSPNAIAIGLVTFTAGFCATYLFDGYRQAVMAFAKAL